MSLPEIQLAYSFCPNDTALFGPLSCGLIGLNDHTTTTHLHDIETLNVMAGEEIYDITKLSTYSFLRNQHNYRMLQVGTAMGFDCGPLLVSRAGAQPNLASATVLMPGVNTTAYLLFRILFPQSPPACHYFLPYNEIADAIATGEYEIGIIIHETRFSYQEKNLVSIGDLGQMWHSKTKLPVPLGCCAAHKRIGSDVVDNIEKRLIQGIDENLSGTDTVKSYIKQHATEMDENAVSAHISLYVNSYTRAPGLSGGKAFQQLAQLANDCGLLGNQRRVDNY